MKRKYSKKWNREWREGRKERKKTELEEKLRRKKELDAGGGQEEKRGNRRRGVGWLNQCTLPLQILPTLYRSLSLSPTNTHRYTVIESVSVWSQIPLPPFPPALQQLSYPVPVHVCACGSLNHSSLTFHSRCGIDCWDTETKKVIGIFFGSVQFLKLLWTKHSALFFFQAFGWTFCWETHGICYWNIQFLLGFWIWGLNNPRQGTIEHPKQKGEYNVDMLKQSEMYKWDQHQVQCFIFCAVMTDRSGIDGGFPERWLKDVLVWHKKTNGILADSFTAFTWQTLKYDFVHPLKWL